MTGYLENATLAVDALSVWYVINLGLVGLDIKLKQIMC